MEECDDLAGPRPQSRHDQGRGAGSGRARLAAPVARGPPVLLFASCSPRSGSRLAPRARSGGAQKKAGRSESTWADHLSHGRPGLSDRPALLGAEAGPRSGPASSPRVRRGSGGVVRGNPLPLWRLDLPVAREDRRRWGGFSCIARSVAAGQAPRRLDGIRCCVPFRLRLTSTLGLKAKSMPGANPARDDGPGPFP